MKETCYMCNEIATTREHVPPKCFFPEEKDLPNGVSYRNDLITVPSCYEHNTVKSKDDEYSWYCLSMSISINEVGVNHFENKIVRSINRNSSIIERLLNGHKSVNVQNPETLEVADTIIFEPDKKRLNGFIEKLSRALYFNHYKNKYDGEIEVYPNFLLNNEGKNESIAKREKIFNNHF